ncbi:MAG: amidase [Sulfitobacter sp.]
MTPPCELSAQEARRQIANATLSVSALLESCIARIEERNPEVNAVVATCYDSARREAAEMDASRDSLAELPLLFGLPVLIKDLIDTKELTTTYGSLCFDQYVPEEDAAIVRKLRQAGAIILGKTNTPEFGAGANTFNKVYGATRNPYDIRLTCGGSSGGSAVAVACGMAPLAIGSDFGGSLRIPASFCGIVGMRPTPGRVPCTSLAVGNSPLWTEGPMARTVADAALCMAAIEGYTPADQRAVPLSEPTTLSAIDLKGVSVGVSADLGVAQLDHAIRETFETVISKVSGVFFRIERLDPDLSAASDIFETIRVTDTYATAHELMETQADKLGDNIRKNLSQAEKLSLIDVAKASAAHTVLFKKFQRIFETQDILIVPATAVSPFPVEHAFPSAINGEPIDDYFAWYAVTWTLSLVGCPIVTVPAGKDHNGMPFGIQVIAPRHRDGLAFSVAAALETALEKLGVT